MKIILIITFLSFSTNFVSQIKLSADGKGNTYELINSVFMEDSRNAVEVPDCNHKDFGRHISETFDTILNKYVFELVLHINKDYDRCKRFDRQRNEIKTNKASNPILLGKKGENINYQWKFKIQKGFQVSKKYTDLHQITYHIKGGNEPLFAFIARERKGKQKFEIVFINNDKKTILKSINLSKITDKWIVVNQTISFAKNGTYSLTLTTLEGESILKIDQKSLQTWNDSMIYTRPKWGIYRSLKNSENLRDEKVFFADFEIHDLKVN